MMGCPPSHGHKAALFLGLSVFGIHSTSYGNMCTWFRALKSPDRLASLIKSLHLFIFPFIQFPPINIQDCGLLRPWPQSVTKQYAGNPTTGCPIPPPHWPSPVIVATTRKVLQHVAAGTELSKGCTVLYPGWKGGARNPRSD
jgi:hypothetical protein